MGGAQAQLPLFFYQQSLSDFVILRHDCRQSTNNHVFASPHFALNFRGLLASSRKRDLFSVSSAASLHICVLARARLTHARTHARTRRLTCKTSVLSPRRMPPDSTNNALKNFVWGGGGTFSPVGGTLSVQKISELLYLLKHVHRVTKKSNYRSTQ